jgi:23S rRNA pseudouridine955/2504/2580 synthase
MIRLMLDLAYEDDEILIVEKPAGLPVQPGAGVRSCVIGILESELPYKPFLVHRLDKDTAGLLIVAKGRDAASRYGALIAGRSLIKTYLAICSGTFSVRNGSFQTNVSERGTAKSARTDFKVRREFSGYSLLELGLITGRMHQIRIQLAAEGKPVLGDDKYGDFALNRALRQEAGLKRLLLFAWKLRLPGADEPVTAKIPPHFGEFLVRFGVGLEEEAC